MSTWISQDDDKKDTGFVLHFTTTDDHEDDKNLEQNPESEEYETGEVISQMSLHLLSMTHQTFVNVVQFDQEDIKEDIQVKRGKTLVFRKPRSKSHRRLQPESSELEEDTVQLINEIDDISNESSYEPKPVAKQDRVTSTLQELAKHIDTPTKKSCLEKTIEVISDPESCPIKCPAILEPPKLSDTLRRGKHLGCFMSRFFLLPVMPRIVGDIWFLVELLIALILFILSLINIQYISNRVFIGLTITTTAIISILTCVDAVLYFYELRSCKLCYQFYKGQNMSHDIEKKVLCFCCPCIPTKLVKLFNRWYEIIRTILTECLMYPLLVVCLFELLNNGSFHYKGHNTITFSIFVIACFYIVMSVYIVRPMMATITVVRLQRLTSTTTNDSSYTRVFLVFLLHVLAQIFVHLLCVIVVGLKIWQEQSTNGGTYNATAFLWVVMIGGWIIPFMGVVSFFVVNYYWLQQFSLGFFVDMIGLLEEPYFAEAVLQGKGVSYSEQEKSKNLLEDVCYHDVKKEAKIRNERTNFVAKIIYPLKVPLMIMFAVFYNFVMGGFITSLLLDYDDNGNVTLITMNTGAGITTLVTIVFLIISNIHVILIINLWLISMIVTSFLLMLCSPVLAVIGVVIIIKKCTHHT